MKPLDIKAMLRGEPLVTRDGRKVKLIGYVPEAVDEKIIALVGDELCMFYEDGKYYRNSEYKCDLFMKPPPVCSINQYKFPEPVQEPLREGQTYWLVDLSNPNGVSYHCWDGDETDYIWMSRGLIQLTEEGAEQQIKAMLAALEVNYEKHI